MRTLIVLACTPSLALAQATFSGLGYASSTVLYSEGYAVSGDGSVAAGGSLITGGLGGQSVAYGWSEGVLTPVWFAAGGSSISFGVSADGGTIIGIADFGAFSPLGSQAFVYTASTGPELLGDFPSNPTGVPRSTGRALSADGSTLVGGGLSANGNEAFVMNLATRQFIGLGALQGTAFNSVAYGVSGDGSIVVGASSFGAQETQAFRWTSTGGMQGLGYLPSPTWLTKYSIADAVSADGQVIVGRSRSNNSQNGLEGFRWTQATGMVGLGDLPGGSFQSFAFAANADGSVIVGMATIEGAPGPFGPGSASRAFIWDAQNGMRDLQATLMAAGAPMTGWNLKEARAVSADGRTIVGTGTGPDGNTQAWIATLPPLSCYANCDGSTGSPKLTANDFQCFLNSYANGDTYANCDASIGSPLLTANDFLCFLNKFAAGCS
ncbi:MAG: hypothetical protein KF678_05230 [Phycisphaeraceae bacterium]|nr:hypothetical protein [Phycisphaeraceae bacterium]